MPRLSTSDQLALIEMESRRCTPWARVGVNPEILVREYRPRLHRPLDCPRYDRVYLPSEVRWEGACKNFEVNRLYCVFCNACPMSNDFKKIPFDVRRACDAAMGW